MSESNFNTSGSKYLRKMECLVNGHADVYAVLHAFAVTCPARQHAIKKLLCSGIRGKGSVLQDLMEARDAIDRAIQMASCIETHLQPGQDAPPQQKNEVIYRAIRPTHRAVGPCVFTVDCVVSGTGDTNIDDGEPVEVINDAFREQSVLLRRSSGMVIRCSLRDFVGNFESIRANA